MDGPEISVYGEAKGEYTRQLCVFLAPCLETYFLRLLDEARSQAETSQKYLWTFQNLLQCIPDWNQDKVMRETEVIQKDCKCDYLEELLTAVFIAHTKVLSAIRLSTKQKKLQITIPKIDHFLHRVLSECARTLWTNAFLFVDTNSIEKQKNLRQVSGLIHDSILQAIRGLLPVRTILREYLHEDEDEETSAPSIVEEPEVAVVTSTADASASSATDADASASSATDADASASSATDADASASSATDADASASSATDADASASSATDADASASTATDAPVDTPVDAPADAPTDASLATVAPTDAVAKEVSTVTDVTSPSATLPLAQVPPAASADATPTQPTIFIDTKPSVSFAQEHVMFDSNTLEANEIHDLPFAEAETRVEEEEEEEEEKDQIQITDEVLAMDADETLT
jgi:hypothetical protein